MTKSLWCVNGNILQEADLVKTNYESEMIRCLENIFVGFHTVHSPDKHPQEKLNTKENMLIV